MNLRWAASAAVSLALIPPACTGPERAPEAVPDRRAATPAPPSSPRERVGLTLRQHGRTITIGRTSDVTLVLGGKYYWRDPVSRGARVEVLAVVSDAPESGQTWRLVPRESGIAVLHTVGSPACRPTTPGCPRAERNYTVTLAIRD